MHHRSWRKTSYQPTSLIAVVVSLLFIFTSAAYFVFVPAENDEPTPAEVFDERFSIWESMQPPVFRYVVERNCECPPEFTSAYVVTEDRGDSSAEFFVTVESGSGEFLDSPPQVTHISDIFTELEQALERPNLVEVSYDGRFGYPDSVQIRYPGPRLDIRYDIRDFEVLEHRQE